MWIPQIVKIYWNRNRMGPHWLVALMFSTTQMALPMYLKLSSQNFFELKVDIAGGILNISLAAMALIVMQL
jgi:hypothetical protein